MRTPHELQDEFPGEALFIARLTKSNYEFGQLAARYDEGLVRCLPRDLGEEPIYHEQQRKKRRADPDYVSCDGDNNLSLRR